MSKTYLEKVKSSLAVRQCNILFNRAKRQNLKHRRGGYRSWGAASPLSGKRYRILGSMQAILARCSNDIRAKSIPSPPKRFASATPMIQRQQQAVHFVDFTRATASLKAEKPST